MTRRCAGGFARRPRHPETEKRKAFLLQTAKQCRAKRRQDLGGQGGNKYTARDPKPRFHRGLLLRCAWSSQEKRFAFLRLRMTRAAGKPTRAPPRHPSNCVLHPVCIAFVRLVQLPLCLIILNIFLEGIDKKRAL